MRILAVADVHSPTHYEAFALSLAGATKPDLLLMAGDMINRGDAEEYPRLVEAINSTLGIDVPIVACFGNDEYTEIRRGIIAEVGGRITLLDERSTIVEIGDVSVGIVGTQGSLDKPTKWQRESVPSIKRVFAQRAERATSLLRELVGKVDRRILLMHYSPCLETCEGEETRSFTWLGSRKFYSVVMEEQPDLVAHGHVHNSTRHEAMLGATLVRNVAIPAVGGVTELVLWE